MVACAIFFLLSGTTAMCKESKRFPSRARQYNDSANDVKSDQHHKQKERCSPLTTRPSCCFHSSRAARAGGVRAVHRVSAVSGRVTGNPHAATCPQGVHVMHVSGNVSISSWQHPHLGYKTHCHLVTTRSIFYETLQAAKKLTGLNVTSSPFQQMETQ